MYSLLSEEDLEICEEIRSDGGKADEDSKAQCQKKQHKLKIPKNIKLKKSEEALSPEPLLGKIADWVVHVLVGLVGLVSYKPDSFCHSYCEVLFVSPLHF